MTSWSRALNHCVGHDLTQVRQLLGVAEKGAVAKVAVLQGGAITIYLAFAGDGGTSTLTFAAAVGHGTWILIVTIGLVVGEVAATQPITGVIRARVFVVTVDGRPNAHSLLTMVANGTGVTV